MHFKNIMKSLVSLAAVSFIAGKAQATIPLQLGVVLEPGFEFNKIDPTKKEKDAGEKSFNYMGVDVPVMVQAIFLGGAFKPYFGLGYSFTYLSNDDKKNGNTKTNFKNHNILVQAGVNYMINPLFSAEAFVGYNFIPAPKMYFKLNGKDKNIELDSNNKFQVGLRGYYTVMDGLDVGIAAKGIFAFMKLKGASDSNYVMGFQANLSVRKRFDLLK